MQTNYKCEKSIISTELKSKILLEKMIKIARKCYQIKSKGSKCPSSENILKFWEPELGLFQNF